MKKNISNQSDMSYAVTINYPDGETVVYLHPTLENATTFLEESIHSTVENYPLDTNEEIKWYIEDNKRCGCIFIHDRDIEITQSSTFLVGNVYR